MGGQLRRRGEGPALGRVARLAHALPPVSGAARATGGATWLATTPYGVRPVPRNLGGGASAADWLRDGGSAGARWRPASRAPRRSGCSCPASAAVVPAIGRWPIPRGRRSCWPLRAARPGPPTGGCSRPCGGTRRRWCWSRRRWPDWSPGCRCRPGSPTPTMAFLPGGRPVAATSWAAGADPGAELRDSLARRRRGGRRGRRDAGAPAVGDRDGLPRQPAAGARPGGGRRPAGDRAGRTARGRRGCAVAGAAVRGRRRRALHPAGVVLPDGRAAGRRAVHLVPAPSARRSGRLLLADAARRLGSGRKSIESPNSCQR